MFNTVYSNQCSCSIRPVNKHADGYFDMSVIEYSR